MRRWLSYASSSNWLRVVGVATIVLLGCYLMVQQSIRLGANDAPLAAAQTAKKQLEQGSPPASVIPKVSSNLTNEALVFITVTDSSHNILATSADWAGKTPILPPAGTFNTALQKGSDWFTWQPTDDIRQAVEILPYSYKSQAGFVVAGQSLNPTENRINRLSWITLFAWLGVVIWATFIPVPSLRK